MTQADWAHIAIGCVVIVNFLLLCTACFFLYKGLKTQAKYDELMHDALRYIVRWQKATAKMMVKDTEMLTDHDKHVESLLVKADEIVVQLQKITSRNDG